MRAALDRVREEQGPDAVILSTGRTETGVEVITAVDYDPALAAGALAALSPQPAAAAVAAPAPAPSPRVIWSQDESVLAMRREIEALRQMLEQQLARLSWDGLARREPFRAQVLHELCGLDLATDLALRLVDEMPPVARPENPAGVALALLLRHLPVVDPAPVEAGGPWALVGPTGAGKTTTIGKLAARQAGSGRAGLGGLIALDSYQIGAGERLAAHARRLGTRLRLVATPAELSSALAATDGAALTLVDTAGFAQRDLRFAGQAAQLAAAAPTLRTLLVLPANADAATLDSVIRAHAVLRPAGCILTKIDETASLGAALSAILRHQLPLAYLCAGQRVPEDLYPAAERRVWLVRLAVKLRAAAARPEPAATEACEVRAHG